MTMESGMFQAVLVLLGDVAPDIDILRTGVQEAYHITGQCELGGPVWSDDPQAVVGRDLMTRIDILADGPAATVDEAEARECIDVFCDAYADLPRPASLIAVRVQQYRTDPDLPEDLPVAVLAEIVHLLMEVTDADYVRLPGPAGLMTADRFRTEFNSVADPLALGHDPALDEGEAELELEPDLPRRQGQHHAEARAGRTAQRRRHAPFPDIDEVGDRLEGEWYRLRPEEFENAARPRRNRGTGDSSTAVTIPVEARLATWTVNASVAVFAPPVAASLAVYNLLRGEDFRLSAHAMALTGLFAALNAWGAPMPLVGLL